MKRVVKSCLIASAMFYSGCTTRELSFNGFGSYKSTRFGNKEAIGEVEIHGKDGTVFIIKNYSSDQVQALREIAAGAAEGAVKGATGGATPRSVIPDGYKLVPKDDPSIPQLEIP